jgi:type II secretory pathway predicted ATPase ExeA
MGLHRDPFAAEKDLLFYFAVDSFEQRLTLLQRLLEGKDALILVLGETGGGKTTLLNRFLDSLDTPWRSGRIRTRSNRSAVFKTLDNHPIFIVKDPRAPVVLFDNAHELSRNELRHLLQDVLKSGRSRKVKRLVLFGEPDLTTAVTAMSDKLMGEAAVNKIYMPTLNPAESGEYLRHRLMMAGYAGKDPFNNKILQRLHQRSGGIPGKLNAVADRWLEKNIPTAPFGMRAWLRGPKAKWFWGAAVAAFILMLGTLLLRNTRPPQAPSQALSIKGSSGKTIGAKITDREQSTARRIAGVPLRPIADISGVHSSATEPPAIQVQDLARPVPPKTTASIESAASGAVPERPAQRGNEPATAREKPSGETPGLLREAWILAQNPGYYTLQIMGVRKEASLKRFVAENPSLKNYATAYYRTSYRGDEWYPLLCGVYPSVNEARTAIERLPQNIRLSNPWIRKLSGIQTAIRNRRP